MAIQNTKHQAAELDRSLPKLSLTDALNHANRETGDFHVEFHHAGATATTWIKVRRRPEYKEIQVSGLKVNRLHWIDLIEFEVTNKPKTIMLNGRPTQVRDTNRGYRCPRYSWTTQKDTGLPDRFTGRVQVISQAHTDEQ